MRSDGSGGMREMATQLIRTLSFTRETYYCQICLDNCPEQDGYTLGGCGHVFCNDCIAGYLESRIRDGQTHLPCPFLPEGDTDTGGLDTGCAISINDGDVSMIGGPALLERLERFRQMRQDASYRDCPQCSNPVLGGSAWRPNLTCGGCSLTFCFVHSNAHPGQTCRQYERARRVQERDAAAAIAAISRPCPGCKTPIMRTGGCNHMTCTRCRTDFCWLCGRSLGRNAGTYPNHYASWNVCGCPGLQMAGGCLQNRSRPVVSLCMCLYRMAFIIMSAVWAALWIAMIPLFPIYYIVLGIAVCCCGADFEDEMCSLPCKCLCLPCKCCGDD